MGDRRDKNMDKNEGGGLPLPLDGGLRRSRRVRKLPPLPPSPSSQIEGGSAASATGRKWKRGRQQGAEEVLTHDEDDVKVMKSVKVSSPTKANKDIVVGGVGVESGEDETGKRSLSLDQQQQLVGKRKARQSKKVGGAVVKPGEASSVMSIPSGRSEDGPLKQSVGEEEAHPCLFIENILEVIFQHIIGGPGSRGDVRSIRQVCKTWKDSATSVYRRNGTTLTFHAEKCQYPPGRYKPLTKFMETMKSSQMIPIQKFKFDNTVFSKESPKMLRDFLVICGPEVVSLDLYINSVDAEMIMLNLQNLSELNMLKLRALKVFTTGNFRSEIEIEANRVHGIVNLIQLLLTAAKRLRELDLSCWPRSSSFHQSGQVHIMQPLGPIIATAIPKTVKQLELGFDMNEPTFNNLAEVGLALDKFQYGVPSAFEPRVLYKFLQSQGATLKELRLCEEKVVVELPSLSELVNLELDDVVIRIAAHPDFAKTFPKLHRLHIGGIGSDTALQAWLSSLKTPSQSLKVLHLGWDYTSLGSSIKDIARFLPSMVDLHISLSHGNKGALLEIFKYLGNLESLSISFHYQTGQCPHWPDSIFSGISEADYARIRESNGFGNINLNDFQRQPSIFNLTKLRKLSVDNCSFNSGVSFTDFAAHFVFLKMGSLREISFPTGCPRHPIPFSPRYVGLLRKRLILRGGVLNN